MPRTYSWIGFGHVYVVLQKQVPPLRDRFASRSNRFGRDDSFVSVERTALVVQSCESALALHFISYKLCHPDRVSWAAEPINWRVEGPALSFLSAFPIRLISLPRLG